MWSRRNVSVRVVKTVTAHVWTEVLVLSVVVLVPSVTN